MIQLPESWLRWSIVKKELFLELENLGYIDEQSYLWFENLPAAVETQYTSSLSLKKKTKYVLWNDRLRSLVFLNFDSRGGTGGFRGRGDLKSMTIINGHWKRLFVGLGVVTFCRHCIGYNPSSTAFRASGTLHKQCLHNVKPNPTKTVYQCPSDELTGPLHG